MISRYACPCCGVDGMTKAAKQAFEAIEKETGRLVITSAYRCDKHNHEVGGAGKSKHMEGIAIDVLIGIDESRKLLIKAARKNGFNGFGLGSNFVHIDMRSNFCLWEYK